MKVLVVGGGGREHAICWALKKSPKVTELFCAPGNAGISAIATCVPIGATDLDAMVQWAKENAMDLVMVAPDDPLALGMVEAWRPPAPLADTVRLTALYHAAHRRKDACAACGT